jgi:TnpA family transposase
VRSKLANNDSARTTGAVTTHKQTRSDLANRTIPGTQRDSLHVLDGLLANQTGIRPEMVSTGTAGASEIVFALAWALGYRWAPRLADLPDQRLWRIDRDAHYGPLNGLARHRINTRLIAENWDEICRLAASLRAGTVIPSAILRTLQRGPSPSSLARALAELGRVIKTLHVLEYAHDPAYRRTIHHLLSRGERRNSLARDVFHGRRGQLRRHYQAGQENQLGSLGIMINVIVLWQTRYMQAALDHLAATGYQLDPADVARLTHSGTPPSTWRAATAPPVGRPLLGSGRYEPGGSGSCTNPRHRPTWAWRRRRPRRRAACSRIPGTRT